jgi:hypothetical protein
MNKNQLNDATAPRSAFLVAKMSDGSRWKLPVAKLLESIADSWQKYWEDEGKPGTREEALEEAWLERLHPIVVPWVGKLRHDREKFADWGWIRDEAGELIFKVPIPLCLSEEDLQKYRREKIDPTQARVDALLNALNGHNGKDDPR